MSWWGWVIGGVILLGAELAFVNAEFYLVFVGTAALIVGLITTSGALAVWAQWAVFASLVLVLMPIFRRRIYYRLRGHSPEVHAGPVGSTFTLPVALAPGESCKTEHAGSFWTVLNDSDSAIAAGTRVRITHIQGLNLLVKPTTS